MKVNKLTILLESKVDEIRELIVTNMQSKGVVESECQRLCLENRLNCFEQYINGIEQSDLK